MKMVPDTTGRFVERPFYSEQELDAECEGLAHQLLQSRRGLITFPIGTDDLEVLIEQHGAELDAYADLSPHGNDVEGMTEFFRNRGPKVFISDTLSTNSRRGNRFRTTLTHEFGHVHFHGHLWATRFAAGDLFLSDADDNRVISRRGDVHQAAKSDWMEWQAGYVSGAILMPVTRVRELVSEYCAARECHAAVDKSSAQVRALTELLMEEFEVSEEAARLRLLKLELLSTADKQPSLFDH